MEHQTYHSRVASVTYQDWKFVVGIGHIEESLNVRRSCRLCIFGGATSTESVLGEKDATNLCCFHAQACAGIASTPRNRTVRQRVSSWISTQPYKKDTGRYLMLGRCPTRPCSGVPLFSFSSELRLDPGIDLDALWDIKGAISSAGGVISCCCWS